MEFISRECKDPFSQGLVKFSQGLVKERRGRVTIELILWALIILSIPMIDIIINTICIYVKICQVKVGLARNKKALQKLLSEWEEQKYKEGEGE